MDADQADLLSRYLGPLELRIMDDIWQHGPSTVGDVLDRLNESSRRSLVYNTVMSTLTRLYDKDFLERDRRGRAYVYRGEGPDAFMRAQATRTTREMIDELGELGVAGIMDGLEADDDTRRLMQQLLDGDAG